MANSIRVQSKTEYVIEVNDKGETISFDTADTGLTSRMFQMYEAIDKLTQEYEAKAKELAERPDEARSTLHMEDPDNTDGEGIEKVLITKNQYEGAELVDSFYKEARVALDKFLGPGACQKIFGDKNYTAMFNDLLEALAPQFEKMGIRAANIRKSAAIKHAPNRKQKRALK